MAQVRLENVSKIFDDKVVAVKNISLDIKDKEFMVIVGPSGCGKTTILRMIAGLEEITEGTITIADTVVNHVPPKDRDIAMVFQNYALYPHMTAFQNMAFGLKLRKFPRDEIKRRVEETARLLGIERLLERKPKALSGGQRQRIALGRAIVRNPKAFLFDEPLSNLDAKLRVTTRAELKALHHRLQTTSIYVTHDQAEAMTLGDKICIMYEGQIQQVASPMEVYDNPTNQFVAGFLGTPPMNFIKGHIELDIDILKFVTEEFVIKVLPSCYNKLTPFKGQEIVIGIRPEHLSPVPFEGQSENEILVKINIVEPLGDRMDVYCSTQSENKLIANLAPHLSIDRGQTLRLFVNTPKTHFFEPGDLGKNLTLQHNILKK